MVSIYFGLYPLNSLPKEINGNAFEICIVLIKNDLIDCTLYTGSQWKPLCWINNALDF